MRVMLPSRLMSAWLRCGSVAPMRVVGTSRNENRSRDWTKLKAT